MEAVELFAGAGGMAIGVKEAGFRHSMLVERCASCIATLHINGMFEDSFVMYGDSSAVDYSALRGIDLVSGGPVCRPFLFGRPDGKSTMAGDSTDEFIRAVAEIRPKAFLLESLKEVTRSSSSVFLSSLINNLTAPYVSRREGMTEIEYRGEVARMAICNPEYAVSFGILNAADYGVPQTRERFFVVGIRRDIEKKFSFPEATHSKLALQYSQSVIMEYWRRYNLPRSFTEDLVVAGAVAELWKNTPEKKLPWVTIRDAIGCVWPESAREVKTYPGHPGSPIDNPSWAISPMRTEGYACENNILLPDGRCRRMSMHEMLILQGFPPEYVVCGTELEAVRQIGSAVPPPLAKAIALKIGETIS